MTKGNSFSCTRENCDFKTSVRIEMVYHSVKIHGAVYSRHYLSMLYPLTDIHRAMKKELLELTPP